MFDEFMIISKQYFTITLNARSVLSITPDNPMIKVNLAIPDIIILDITVLVSFEKSENKML